MFNSVVVKELIYLKELKKNVGLKQFYIAKRDSANLGILISTIKEIINP